MNSKTTSYDISYIQWPKDMTMSEIINVNVSLVSMVYEKYYYGMKQHQTEQHSAFIINKLPS